MYRPWIPLLLVIVITPWFLIAASSRREGTPKALVATRLGLPDLVVAPVPRQLPAYERDGWKHWVDQDKDCQDTRAEVLIRQSLVDVQFKDARGCAIESGLWLDPYKGTVIRLASDLDIDHLVPLGNAHRSGAAQWGAEQKQAFANDLAYPWHLVAVGKSVNRQKGDRGPEAWKPPDGRFRCPYAVAWVQIKSKWGLSATNAERKALDQMLRTCREG